MLEWVCEIVRRRDHYDTVHVELRMAKRRIVDAEVREVMQSAVADIIEDYPADKYGPSCLIYGTTAAGRVLHVQANPQGVTITAYDPDPAEWIDLKRRRT